MVTVKSAKLSPPAGCDPTLDVWKGLFHPHPLGRLGDPHGVMVWAEEVTLAANVVRSPSSRTLFLSKDTLKGQFHFCFSDTRVITLLGTLTFQTVSL